MGSGRLDYKPDEAMGGVGKAEPMWGKTEREYEEEEPMGGEILLKGRRRIPSEDLEDKVQTQGGRNGDLDIIYCEYHFSSASRQSSALFSTCINLDMAKKIGDMVF